MNVSTMLGSAALVCALTCTACTSSSGGAGAAGGTTPGSHTTTAVTSTTPVSSPPVSSTAPATSSSSSTSTRPASWCVDGEITVGATANPEGAAAGHDSVILTFTNSSTRTCVLYG